MLQGCTTGDTYVRHGQEAAKQPFATTHLPLDPALFTTQLVTKYVTNPALFCHPSSAGPSPFPHSPFSWYKRAAHCPSHPPSTSYNCLSNSTSQNSNQTCVAFTRSKSSSLSAGTRWSNEPVSQASHALQKYESVGTIMRGGTPDVHPLPALNRGSSSSAILTKSSAQASAKLASRPRGRRRRSRG